MNKKKIYKQLPVKKKHLRKKNYQKKFLLKIKSLMFNLKSKNIKKFK